MNDTGSSEANRAWVLLFFLLSGLTGLIYEIVWMKMLTLTLGNTVYSTTTVLASFMGGLALGSFLAGRFLHRFRNPLRVYGLLEGVIGVYALLVPLLILASQPLFRYVYQNVDASSHTLGILRIVVCGVILLVPTTLMGATLPILSQFLARRSTELGWTVGKLYGINMLGAVLGSSSAGFLLIPALGISWTLRLAALINLAIAAAVWAVSRPGTDEPDTKRKKQKKHKKQKKQSPEPASLEAPGARVIAGVVVAIGFAGMASMIYQIAWTRVLALLIGSSVYAFSLIVTAFIAGLALGPLVVGKLIDRRRNRVLTLVLIEVAVGIAALAMVPIFGRLPTYFTQMFLESSYSFQRLQWTEFGILFLLMFVPTFLMGAAFPVAIRICATGLERFGKTVGNVYAVNTLGAIAGTLIGGFVLVPWLGVQKAIFVAVLINMVAAGTVLLALPGLSVRRVALALATVAITFAAWRQIPSWNSLLLVSGPYIYAERYKGVSQSDLQDAMTRGRELIFFEEGLHATISVEQTAGGGDLILQVNGKADASAKGDAATQLMLGHLPMLLHPEAKDVLVIGLGSGMTLGAVEQYPVDSIDVVELEPAVVRANTFFAPFTGNSLDDPRVNLLVTDGRNHLALTDRRYDVIISEPSNPWVAGMANLFTREFFEMSKKRLREGGVICQWLHAYSMISADFQTLVATFQSVFPRMILWEFGLAGDYILIGSLDGMDVPYETVRSLLDNEKMAVHRKKMNVSDLPSLLGKVVLDEKAAAEYVKGAHLHTDDNARLEYSAPKGFFKNEKETLLRDIYAHRSSPAEVLRSFGWQGASSDVADKIERVFDAREDLLEGYLLMQQRDGTGAIESLTRSLEKNPKEVRAVDLLQRIYVEMGERYEQLDEHEKARDAYAEAIKVLSDFTSDDPELLRHQFDLNRAYARNQVRLGRMSLVTDDLETAAEAFRSSMEEGLESSDSRNQLGAIYESLGKRAEALAEYERALELVPGNLAARINYANVCLRLGRFEEAIDNYREAQRIEPDSERIHYNLGVAYYQQMKWGEAANEWRRTLELNPNFPQARQSLDKVLSIIAGQSP